MTRADEVAVGMRGTTSGFPATITRICEWSRARSADGVEEVMIEARVSGGLVCVSCRDFVPEKGVR